MVGRLPSFPIGPFLGAIHECFGVYFRGFWSGTAQVTHKTLPYRISLPPRNPDFMYRGAKIVWPICRFFLHKLSEGNVSTSTCRKYSLNYLQCESQDRWVKLSLHSYFHILKWTSWWFQPVWKIWSSNWKEPSSSIFGHVFSKWFCPSPFWSYRGWCHSVGPTWLVSVWTCFFLGRYELRNRGEQSGVLIRILIMTQ